MTVQSQSQPILYSVDPLFFVYGQSYRCIVGNKLSLLFHSSLFIWLSAHKGWSA